MRDFQKVVIGLVQIGLREPDADGNDMAALELMMPPPPRREVMTFLVKDMSRRWGRNGTADEGQKSEG